MDLSQYTQYAGGSGGGGGGSPSTGISSSASSGRNIFNNGAVGSITPAMALIAGTVAVVLVIVAFAFSRD